MKYILRLISLCVLFPHLLLGQMETNTSFQQAEESLMSQLITYPQEKIHLHTDRDLYVPGERIWFKAYVADAATHQYATFSRYVYVELIDACDSLVNRVMIRPTDEGLLYGHLFLSELIPEGDYTLRAYTRYMENLGDDYFFKKNIRIANLLSSVTEPAPTRQKEKAEKQEEEYDVSFFPEGGNLLAGVPCKVAFKTLNKNGYPEMISGHLVDEDGVEILSAQTLHAGMGAFSYIPVEGKRYFLKCSNTHGMEKSFELPVAHPQAYALTAVWRNGKLQVGVQKAKQSPDIPCYLFVHCRGLLLYYSAWDVNKEVLTFTEEQLPAGVIQFILFDGQMNPLSERLVFSKHNDGTQTVLQTDKEVYETRENILASLSVTDIEGNPLTGHLSVAITDDQDLAIDTATTILSSLLLSSELRGYIENPAYYLQDDLYAATALDYLMLTHGWRRYDVPQTLKGNPAYPQIPFQTTQEISGKAASLMRSKPLADSHISVVVDGNYGSAFTDEKGRFRFQGFEYPDSTTYFIQALGKRGSSWIHLDLELESYPALVHAPQSPVVEAIRAKESTEDLFITKAEQRAQYDDDMRVIHLNEVLITASRYQRKREEARLQHWQNLGAEITVRREDFEDSHPMFVTDLIRKLPGVRVSGNGFVEIVPPTFKPTPPLVFIDGTLYRWPETMQTQADSPLEMISVREVESIDITRDGGAAIFGMLGMGGAISITTRKGASDREKYNYSLYTPLGYQRPAEFYAPRYETKEARHLTNPDYRTTLYWKPDIILSEEGEAAFDFYASDFPTTYSVVLEGLTSDGRILRQVKKIQIK
ncbi:TonB-dependent receptor plug domain-containing protein [Parabacteroides sp. PF5-6]|uniref:TonB-dependent receptor n=1 Tax=Parabacteroides sp. PF5-6 TaxID=1742403 RepID=UPI0024060ED9|nr:TonB-dependent receptor plug domain-containing protein [Parabacteroides sp. PF5-6]MDF9829425.1 hypothetical protein [Parabacteroides sp. PF5-6]